MLVTLVRGGIGLTREPGGGCAHGTGGTGALLVALGVVAALAVVGHGVDHRAVDVAAQEAHHHLLAHPGMKTAPWFAPAMDWPTRTQVKLASLAGRSLRWDASAGGWHCRRAASGTAP
jgi:hypothetical protein